MHNSKICAFLFLYKIIPCIDVKLYILLKYDVLFARFVIGNNILHHNLLYDYYALINVV